MWVLSAVTSVGFPRAKETIIDLAGLLEYRYGEGMIVPVRSEAE